MKKKILRTLVFIISIIFILIIFLSTIGIETKRLNSQIGIIVKNYNENLEIELNKIKIVLDPFRLQINLKTVGSKLKNKNEIIELENIKTKISIQSLINNEFSLSNIQISTRSLELKNLISFSRSLQNSPQLFILEKIIKKGYLIADLNLEFDTKGKIKSNYIIKGLVKDVKLSLLKKYNLDKLDFIFDISDNNFIFQDLSLFLNSIPLTSQRIHIKRNNEKFLIDGEVKNKNIDFKKELLKLLLDSYNPKLEIKNLNFSSENKFSFIINKKLKIDNLRLTSKVKINNLLFLNKKELKSILPNIKEEINLYDHDIEIEYKQKKLLLKGEGDILIQNDKDKISYTIDKKKKKYNIKSSLEILNNPLIIDLLNYESKANSNILIKFDGDYFLNQKLLIKNLSLVNNKNKIEIKSLLIDKNQKIEKLDKIILNYHDKENIKNNINIVNNNNNYLLSGSSFNASQIIKRLIEEDSQSKINIFSKNFNINLKVDQVSLDEKSKVENLKGNFYIKNNEILDGKLDALFSQNKFIKFTVNSNHEGKVTTLFLDNAEPIVKRYKFIKGYEGGSLDFYSFKKGNNTQSTLKIYDFKLKELPALTKILTLASLQGIADILSGEGIRFDEFEMNFDNQKTLMTIKEIYAIGPAISVLMDGYVEKDKIISLRGSLVPATTINKAIGSIPVLGKILVGSKTGEGVFGVSFKIKGAPGNLETSVNPIKTLTPRFITRTLEKIKKN